MAGTLAADRATGKNGRKTTSQVVVALRTIGLMSIKKTAGFRRWLLLAFSLAVGLPAMAQQMVLLGDRVTLDSPTPGFGSLQRVNFQRGYSTPPLVFVLPDSSSADPATVRVTNITTTGFDVSVFEPPGEDANHPAAEITYLAISPGVYTVGGNRIEAGLLTTSSFQSQVLPGDSWQTLSFSAGLPATATLLLELQGAANGSLSAGVTPSPWVTVTARNVSSTGAEVALERSETSNGSITNPETIAYLAIASGSSGSFGGPGGQTQYSAVRSADAVTGWDNGCTSVPLGGSYTAPVVVASKSTRDGSDGGWLRSCSESSSSIGLTVDEDRSQDSDRSHTTEVVSVLAFSRIFNANLPGGRGWEANRATVPGYSGATLSFTQVSFPETFASIPLVFTIPTAGDPAPASVRIRAVTASGFQAAAVEPPGSLGAHDAMTIDYLAVLPGQHTLGDGALFEAGFVDTTSVQRAANVGGAQAWDAVTFGSGFAAPPALLAQIQTTSNSDPGADPGAPFVPWLTVAADGLSATGVQVALERSEADDGSVTAAERIGFFAFSANRHGTLTDLANVELSYDTRQASGAARGFDDGCFSVSFTQPFSSAPLAVAHGTTRNGNNGGWLRRCALSPSAIGVQIDEDIDNDAERAHIAEDVGVIAFERPFRWQPFPDLVLTTTLVSISDVTGASLPKSIPGAVLEYQITVTNTGRGSSDTDTVIITDAVPAGTELFVGDLDGSGNPVIYVDGAPPNSSGLIFDASTDMSFSDDDGASYGYAPGAGDWDSAVTNLRINPRGAFTAGTAVNSPSFTIRYRVRVR